MSWGARIQEIRKTLNLTQAEFAEKLRISQAHVSKIEKDQISPSELLLSYICCNFHVSRKWLDTGQGEMFISPERILKNQMARFGEQAFLNAISNILDERGLTVTAARSAHRADTGDPVLDRMVNTLYDLWAVGDEKLKHWAEVQFNRAFPDDITEIIQKKQKENLGHTPAG